MVVPMFIILMLLVNGFFLLFMGQQIMCHAFVQSAESLSFDPYAVGRADANEDDSLTGMFIDLFTIGQGGYVSTDAWYKEESGNLEEIARTRFALFIHPEQAHAEKLLEHVGIEGGLDGLDFSESSVEDGVLTLKANYVQNFVFNAAGLASIDRTLCVKVNLFEYNECNSSN